MDVPQPEIEFANIAFEILDKNALAFILEKLDPKTVLSLCQTNERFSEVCRDQAVFRRLLQVHFNWPDNWTGSDPKTQYGTAAAGIATKYSVTLVTSPSPALGEIAKPDEKVTIANWTNFHRLKRTDKVGFEIYGTKIRRGVKVWLVAYVPDQEYEVPDVSVFASEENAIDSIVEIKEDGLRRTMERLRDLWGQDSANEDLYGDGDVERETFEVWLKNNGYAHMESEKEARAFVKKHGYYGMIPDWAAGERAAYQLSFTVLVEEVTLM